MKQLLLKIKDEITYFWEVNEETIWCLLFIVWLGYVLY